MPNFDIELSMNPPVIGIDEVGRGPLAGPVVSCACVFLDYSLTEYDLSILNDSKQLSTINRNKAMELILLMKKRKKIDFALGQASVNEIDKINILEATKLSMKRALSKLNIKKGNVIIDGKIELNQKNFSYKSIIKGDNLSITIATASIIAKVHRDKYMSKIGKKYPYFFWNSNAGYGTKKHIEQIKQYGISPHHRKSFKPIKSFIHS